MGRDLAMYLKFLKFQAVQFFIIFVLSFSTMIPLYWSGSDAERYLTKTLTLNNTSNKNSSLFSDAPINSTFGLSAKDSSYNLIMITILNIQSDEKKLAYSYAFVTVVSCVVYFQIFKFWRDTSVWNDINFERGEDMYFSQLQNHVVFIRGIPKNINPVTGSDEIKRILKRTFQNQLIDFKIVGQHNDLYILGQLWQELCDQL